MNKFGITCKFIPNINEEISEKPKYEVISLEKDKNRNSAISRKIYSHFTSLNNALDILINQRMKAFTVIKHRQEKECYSNEVADRKYSISFSHDLKFSQENGMFNAFGDKHRGCKITFIVDKNEKFDDILLNDDEYVDLVNKNNKFIKAVFCIEKSGLFVTYPEGKNSSISVRKYFADVVYQEEINSKNNMFMEQNILNKPQPINSNYDYQNETALTFTINKISNITQDEISNIEYMIVRICIEKIKQIKIKFGKKVNDDRKRDFKEKLSKKNYTNIIYEN